MVERYKTFTVLIANIARNIRKIKSEEMANDGGRVALNDEETEYPEPKGERFNDQPPWKRIIVLIAGATMNYLLALILLITMFTCVGRPFYKVMEINTETETSVLVESPFEIGDVIEKIDGKNMYMITDYMDVLQGKKAGDNVKVVVPAGITSLTIKKVY